MKRLVLYFTIITLLGACAAPAVPHYLPKRTITHHAWLPMIVQTYYVPGQTLPAWNWPKWGYGRPTQHDVSDAALRQGVTNFWWYDWGSHCLDDKQVPMVWRDISADLWLCNDGRPLLLLNEPDVTGQAELTPTEVADKLWIIATEGWYGEVWCCGTETWHLDYIDAVIDSYTTRYGVWPAVGWHVHMYSNDAVWVSDLQDANKYVPLALAKLDTFITHMRARGLLGRGVVLTEYGALSAWWPNIQLWHSPAMLVPTFTTYADGIRQRPDVLAAAWFSSYYSSLSASDLLWSNSTLTELGTAWRANVIR